MNQECGVFCQFCLRTKEALGPNEQLQSCKITVTDEAEQITLCSFCKALRSHLQKFLPQTPTTPTQMYDQGAIFIQIPLVDGSEYPVYESDIAEWEEIYKAVNVPVALQRIRQWCLSNPTKQKTKRGARRFITGWLERSQNRGGDRQNVGYKTKTTLSRSDGRPASWPKQPF